MKISSRIQSGSSSASHIRRSRFPQEGRVWGAGRRGVFRPGGGSLVPQGQAGAWALSAGSGARVFYDLTWTLGFFTPTFQSLLHPQGTVIPPLWTLFDVFKFS